MTACFDTNRNECIFKMYTAKEGILSNSVQLAKVGQDWIGVKLESFLQKVLSSNL